MIDSEGGRPSDNDCMWVSHAHHNRRELWDSPSAHRSSLVHLRNDLGLFTIAIYKRKTKVIRINLQWLAGGDTYGDRSENRSRCENEKVNACRDETHALCEFYRQSHQAPCVPRSFLLVRENEEVPDFVKQNGNRLHVGFFEFHDRHFADSPGPADGTSRRQGGRPFGFGGRRGSRRLRS